MRRYLVIILIVLVLAVPFALRAVVGRSAGPANSGGGELTLVIVTPHPQSIRREFARAFDAWHREKYGAGVRIDYRTPGGTNDVQRVLETTYRPYRDKITGKLPADVPADIDLAWGGGDFFFDHQLKPLGILQPMRLPAGVLRSAFPESALNGVKLYDATKSADGTPTPQWVGACLSSFGIMYNPDVYAAIGLPPPRRWADLADPRLAGMVALADPSHSGSAGVAYEMVIQRAMADAEQQLFDRQPGIKRLSAPAREKDPQYRAAVAGGWKRGMSQLVGIAANARYFTDSAAIVPNDVANGQAAVGVAIDYYARVTGAIVGPQRAEFITPAGATAITPDPIAMLAGVTGARRELAEQFVEFLLTPQAQRLWALNVGAPGGPTLDGLHRMPIRSDVYRDMAGWSERENPFALSAGFNERGSWMAMYSDTIPIWDAAWIDSRDQLLDAYDRILRVADPRRRAELLDKLAGLPIRMDEVRTPPAELQKWMDSLADPDAAKACRRIYWTTQFARHYQQVAEEAGRR